MPDLTLAARIRRLRASEIRELLKHAGRPGLISLAGGIPDAGLFDLHAHREAYARVLSDPARARAALQYSTTEGHPPLRAWIAERMARDGVPCGPDNVLVTHGSQQALDLIGKLAIDPGSRVLVDAPTYLGALQCFSAYEPAFAALDAPDPGPARLLYVVPDFANPSGATLDLAERERLLERADAAGALVVEDAAYRALRHEGRDLPSLLALDVARGGSIEGTRVLHCGTFSKTLSPALRLGWVCGPAALIRQLTLIKQGADLHSSTINQMALLEVAGRTFDAQVARARALYRGRRDAMLAALARHAPEGVRWSRPEGGLFVWVTLPEGLDAGPLLPTALDRGLAFVPGAAFFADGSGANTLRLSFSQNGEAEIEEGVARLCALVAEAASRPAAA